MTPTSRALALEARADRLRRFMSELGREAEQEGRLYFAGGATAVLVGWRRSTIDVDIKMEPQLYRFPAIDPRRFRRALEEALA